MTELAKAKQAPETIEEIADGLPYRIVEEMGLGLTFRSCTCGQLPCARLRPLRDALLSALRNERERCWREITAQADEWRRQARLPGAKRNTLNQMAHGAALAANSLRKDN